LADKIVDAHKKLVEYDAKMEEYAKLVRNMNEKVALDFRVLRDVGKAYWDKFRQHNLSILQRDTARDNARQIGARVGAELGPQSEKRLAVIAEYRMPFLVSDPWRALALIAPVALDRLSPVLRQAAVVGKARYQFETSTPDPFGAQDITRVRWAFDTANWWKKILTKECVGTGTFTNNKWQEVFRKFNV
jgi:hypothetical protein